jgi:Family of unknown function (DUF5330)
MVSKWWTRPPDQLSRVFRHQWNIYAESNDSGFLGIFSEFSTPLPQCKHLRFIERCYSGTGPCEMPATEPRRDDRDREMFFLLRMAFWLGLVLVLLPRDKTPESDKLPQIGASEAVSAATAAVSDMGQFCKRQPAACEVGGQAATVIGQRAKDGAQKLYKIITDKKAPETDKKAPDHTGSIGGADEAEYTAAPRDTLTPDDMTVEWQVPPTP